MGLAEAMAGSGMILARPDLPCPGQGNSMSAAVFPRGVAMTKRGFDLVLTIPGLLLITPVLGALALMIRWRLGPPILFEQSRPGLRGEGFKLYKFRTMNEARSAEGRLPTCPSTGSADFCGSAR
jgi:lipopolysaccharide/colanic/teichoic acid biosynthesis glycosyltransferase